MFKVTMEQSGAQQVQERRDQLANSQEEAKKQ
jgi:hypothetical protein